jgi:hypothetical protein
LNSGLRSHGGEGYNNILKSPLKNRGTSFSERERVELGLEGLLPAGKPEALLTKVRVSMGLLRQKPTAIEKYKYLQAIQASDETLLYVLLAHNLEETMPFVYSPNVGNGRACIASGVLPEDFISQ